VWGAVVRRPLQRYNVDHRAEKVVIKIQDPKASAMRAPMYQSDAELLEEIRKTNPGMAEDAVRKDGPLHDRLKTVYVESTDPEDSVPEQGKREQPGRPFPRDTAQYSYDFVPAQLRMDTRDRAARQLPRGKVSLEKAVDILTRYKESNNSLDPNALAEEYRLNPETTRNSLRHFHIFSMVETVTRPTELTRPDPLVAGKDWVEKSKNLAVSQLPSSTSGDPFSHDRRQKEKLLELEAAMEKRMEAERSRREEESERR